MRPKLEFRSGSRSNYEAFCKEHPHIKISFDNWLKIIYDWWELFVQEMIESGDRLKLSWGLGEFFINKRKKKRTRITKDGREVMNLAVNWKATREHGFKIYHLNAHTDGFSFTFAWYPDSAKFKLPEIWKFRIARTHSRHLASLLLVKDNKYKDLYNSWLS